MCVADMLMDDEIENIASILRMLNSPEEPSWRTARGVRFTETEVRASLVGLMGTGLVTPCAECPKSGSCEPIPPSQVGAEYPWDALWFHLEPAGRDALASWWETEGEEKYPLPEKNT
jgi:hypothetical protein